MTVQDLWYLKTRGPDRKPLKSARHGRGNRWRVHWIDPDTGLPAPSESFEKLPQAQARDVEIQNSINQGKYLDPSRGAQSVRDYSQTWRAAQLHSETTRGIVERTFRLHVLPRIGDQNLSQVRSSSLQTMVTEWSSYLAPRTVHLQWLWVQQMFHFAVNDRVLGLDPTNGVKLPRKDPRLKTIPNTEQVHLLLNAVDVRYKAALLLAAGCGLRGGEIFGLEPDCIDWNKGTFEVRQQLRRLGSEPAFLSAPKTLSSYREMDLPPLVAEALQTLTPVKLGLWDKTNPRKPVMRPTQLLWVTPVAGKPFDSGTWDSLMKRSCAAAGLPPFSLHTLRHYFATYLILHGSSVKRVQRLLGHSKPTTTLDTYVGYWPDLESDAADLMDEALR